MSTLNLRRFSKPEVLQQIDKSHLISFFSPHADYFQTRNVDVVGELNSGEPNFAAIRQILITSDDATPDELAEALYYINEVSTEDGADAILEYLEREPPLFPINQNTSPADLALQVWMVLPDVVKRISGNLLSTSKRAFDYYKTSRNPVPDFQAPSEEAIAALENTLDNWFQRHLKGRFSKIICVPKHDYIWFMVRHGKRYSREAVIDDGNSTSFHFRPEKHDVVVYNPANGELRINADSKGEIKLYRAAFGAHIFGDGNYFDLCRQFNLNPIRNDGEDSMLSEDIDEIEFVKLREVQISRGGPFKDVEIFKSDDLFASLQDRDESLPAYGEITQIKIRIKFRHAPAPKIIAITSGNRAQYKCNEDAEAVERWLCNRGFIVDGEDGSND